MPPPLADFATLADVEILAYLAGFAPASSKSLLSASHSLECSSYCSGKVPFIANHFARFLVPSNRSLNFSSSSVPLFHQSNPPNNPSLSSILLIHHSGGLLRQPLPLGSLKFFAKDIHFASSGNKKLGIQSQSSLLM